jgi:hypothetical protein
MKIPVMKYVAGLGQRRKAVVIVAALLAAGTLGGSGMSTTLATQAAESVFEISRSEAHRLQLEASKAKLVGSYEVKAPTPTAGRMSASISSMSPWHHPVPSSSTGTTAGRWASAT